MKKLFLLTITAILSFTLTACSLNNEQDSSKNETVGGSGSVSVSVDTSKNSNSADTSKSNDGLFNDEEVIKNLSTTTYTWENSYEFCAAIIVKNNSNMDCNLTTNAVFKDADGNIIGADDETIYAFEKNTERCIIISNETAFASFDYTYEAEKTGAYKPLSSSISCEASTTPDKAILTFKNNGEKEIGSISYQVLFMAGENVVDTSSGFIYDMAPGGTKSEESEFYNSKKDFDNIKVYYSGYTLEF